jgi:hypothetical protein
MDPVCNLNLIIMAAQSSYRVKKDSKIDTANPKYREALDNIGKQGYELVDSVSPKSMKGTGETPLAATCIAPKNNEDGPVVISFRGTKEIRDLYSDLALTLHGTADEELREAALEYFNKTREQYPGREIIITGHSLGGNLAQDVATRVYNTNKEEKDNGLIHVRTFNSAPIRTKNSNVFKEKPELSDNFKNYRLEADKVSKFNFMASFGDNFSLRMETGLDFTKKIFGHGMPLVEKFFPKNMLEQKIGSSKESSSSLNALSERIAGSLNSYECRVKGQFFSSLRSGVKNLDKLRDMESKISVSLSDGKFDEAIDILKICKNDLKGTVSNQLIDTLIEDVSKKKSDLSIEASSSSEKLVSNVEKVLHEEQEEEEQEEDVRQSFQM